MKLQKYSKSTIDSLVQLFRMVVNMIQFQVYFEEDIKLLYLPMKVRKKANIKDRVTANFIFSNDGENW